MQIFHVFTGIHQLFEASADATPSKVALVGPSHDDQESTDIQELTYYEVEAQANQLCHHLITNMGVTPGTIVGIFLERSTSFYIAMLAILKAGGGYISIDSEYPSDRALYMMEDSNAKVLVTTTSLSSRLSPHMLAGVGLVHLDDDKDSMSIQSQSSDRPLVDGFHSELLCYIIYTSGSTGRPKGVQISHRGVLNLVPAKQLLYQTRPDDRLLQGFSTSFDASVYVIWMAFAHSATLVVGTHAIMRSGPDLPKYLRKYGITWLGCVPTLLSIVDEEIETLRFISVGGEACPKELINRWATPNRRFINSYGPTEASVTATAIECHANMPRVSIGKPLANYKCYVVDDHMNLVPPGAIGELIIGGVSVSRGGYMNMPDKTSAAFKPDTLTHGPYPLYKTGDLARLSPQADIELLGRLDTQVKIRGYRIELTEIESVLSEHPSVQSAVVDVQPLNGVKHLVAFVIPSAGSIDVPELTYAIKAKLPVYMVPSVIETIDSFPTLTSGKIERRRLPRVMEKKAKEMQARRGNGGSSDAIVKMGRYEQIVGREWEKLLGPGCVQANTDDFFELGGHSLLVSQLVSSLRHHDFPTVAAKDVYSAPKLVDMARVLEVLALVQVSLIVVNASVPL